MKKIITLTLLTLNVVFASCDFENEKEKHYRALTRVMKAAGVNDLNYACRLKRMTIAQLKDQEFLDTVKRLCAYRKEYCGKVDMLSAVGGIPKAYYASFANAFEILCEKVTNDRNRGKITKMLVRMPHGEYQGCVDMIHNVLDVLKERTPEFQDSILNNLDDLSPKYYGIFPNVLKYTLEHICLPNDSRDVDLIIDIIQANYRT